MKKLILNLNKIKSNQSGFTLIETLVAVLILTLSIGGILSLAAGGFYSVRYARNQIVANNLLQESLEYVRNTRDSAFLQGGPNPWDIWQDTLQTDINGNVTGNNSDGCFSSNGCIVNPYAISSKVKKCSTTCPYIMYFPDNEFYGYIASYPFSPGSSPYVTSFIRTIKIVPATNDPSNQVVVTGTITWLNGSRSKTIVQSMVLTNWTP